MKATEDFCAQGARAFRNNPGNAALTVVINGMLVYLWQTNNLPGSEKHYTLLMQKSELRIARRFLELTGIELHDWDGYHGRDWLAFQIARMRKHGYKELKRARKQGTRPELNGIQPLFRECEDGLIYAYICKIPEFHFRVVKIGYTGDDINAYLKAYRDREPQLLATMPGDIGSEQAIHRQWSRRLAARREFYHLTFDLRDWIARTFTDFQEDWIKLWDRSCEVEN